jgi:hypothetical protein
MVKHGPMATVAGSKGYRTNVHVFMSLMTPANSLWMIILHSGGKNSKNNSSNGTAAPPDVHAAGDTRAIQQQPPQPQQQQKPAPPESVAIQRILGEDGADDYDAALLLDDVARWDAAAVVRDGLFASSEVEANRARARCVPATPPYSEFNRMLATGWAGSRFR